MRIQVLRWVTVYTSRKILNPDRNRSVIWQLFENFKGYGLMVRESERDKKKINIYDDDDDFYRNLQNGGVKNEGESQKTKTNENR